MKYVAKSYEGVYYSVSLVDDEYDAQDGELIIDNMKDAEAFPIPCKWDGENWVYADVPDMGITYERDLEQERKQKIEYLSNACNAAILNGIDVETTQGTEHFSLEETDQINLTTAYNAVMTGMTGYPYHADKTLCRMFSAEEIKSVSDAAIAHKMYHTTLCNHLMMWARRVETVEELDLITYSENNMPEDLKENMDAIINASTTK